MTMMRGSTATGKFTELAMKRKRCASSCRALASDPLQQEASHYMLLLRHAKAERVLEANNYERLLKMFSRTADGHCAPNLYRASPLYPPTPEDPGPATLKLDPEDSGGRLTLLPAIRPLEAAPAPGASAR